MKLCGCEVFVDPYQEAEDQVRNTHTLMYPPLVSVPPLADIRRVP